MNNIPIRFSTLRTILHRKVVVSLSKLILGSLLITVIISSLIYTPSNTINSSNRNTINIRKDTRKTFIQNTLCTNNTLECENYHWFISRHQKLYDQELASYTISQRYNSVLHALPTYKSTHIHSNKIFWCWLDGESNAPPLYLACLNALRKQCHNHEIVVISSSNIDDYVQFPAHIIQKYNKKQFSRTHFSDILRAELLSRYGGTWIDASVLMTEYNPDFFNKDLFFFQSFHQNDFSHVGSSWFITAEQGSPVLQTTRDLLYEYWKENDKIYNYFLFHFFFRMAYYKYKNVLAPMPKYSNIPYLELGTELGNPFNNERYQHIVMTASLHKLTAKTVKTFPVGLTNLTYHHILREFGTL